MNWIRIFVDVLGVYLIVKALLIFIIINPRTKKILKARHHLTLQVFSELFENPAWQTSKPPEFIAKIFCENWMPNGPRISQGSAVLVHEGGRNYLVTSKHLLALEEFGSGFSSKIKTGFRFLDLLLYLFELDAQKLDKKVFLEIQGQRLVLDGRAFCLDPREDLAIAAAPTSLQSGIPIYKQEATKEMEVSSLGFASGMFLRSQGKMQIPKTKDGQIQHSAPIARGSSGGALLCVENRLKARLIGINVATRSNLSTGCVLGLAVDSKKILPLITRLHQMGKDPFTAYPLSAMMFEICHLAAKVAPKNPQ